MNILINFSTLKKGGGQNVALNFLHCLFEIYDNKNNYFFLVVENSELHQFLLMKKHQYILTASSSPIKRVFLELFKFPSVFKNLNIEIIYTYFGYGLFRGKIPQVCGVAVSNVFFPEIKFWEGGAMHLLTRKLIDKYRIFGIKKADALIFENEEMEKRCHKLFEIPSEKTVFIAPSFNPHFEQKTFNLPEMTECTIKLLMLCGWHRNKNIMRVPEIASFLKKSNLHFHFIISAPVDNSSEHNEFVALVKRYDVADSISIIGPVKKQQLKSLYDQIDYVLLMSKLESFSNNIIEAWYFKKPLIISDGKWASEICNTAAYYVDRESSQKIADSILLLNKSVELQRDLVLSGSEQLKYYPSIEERTKTEISFLEKIHHEF